MNAGSEEEEVLSKVVLEKSPVDLFIWVLGLRDWSYGKDQHISNVLSCLVELGVVEVALGLGNVSRHLLPVGQEVLGQLLGKLNWVCEDGGPGLDFLKVRVDVLAVVEVLWKFLDDLSDLLDSLQNVLEVTLRDVSDCVGDLCLQRRGVGEAGLDFRKVVLLDHSVDKTSNEFLGTLEVHGVVCGEDGGGLLNESHIDCKC